MQPLPLGFLSYERKVEVSGEVYFEVVKKMRGGKTKSDSEPVPFFVNTRNQQIEVLGTHFNVNAYEDDEDERTTLLEGSVKVSPQPHIHTDDISATRPVILKPGQQTVISGQNGLTKPVFVSTDEVMAWKNGLFQFDRTNIHQIMKQVARWYNVDVVYKNNLSQMDFSGTVARSENISEVLKMLELTGAIRFRLEGRTVVVFK
jgi:transmembrane sensor